MKFLTFLSTLAAWRRLWDKTTKKHRKKQPRDQKTPELSLHFGDCLAAFWIHFFNVFLGTLPEWLFAVMGAIVCHFGGKNGVKSVPKVYFWKSADMRLDRVGSIGLRVGPPQIAPTIHEKRVINPTRF